MLGEEWNIRTLLLTALGRKAKGIPNAWGRANLRLDPSWVRELVIKHPGASNGRFWGGGYEFHIRSDLGGPPVLVPRAEHPLVGRDTLRQKSGHVHYAVSLILDLWLGKNLKSPFALFW